MVKDVDSGAKLTPRSTLISGVKLGELFNLAPVSQFHLQMWKITNVPHKVTNEKL